MDFLIVCTMLFAAVFLVSIPVGLLMAEYFHGEE